MNPGLNEINSLIELCDRMIDFINQYGIIHTGNLQYEEYKKQIIRFFNARNNIRHDYGPYLVLDKLHYSGGGYTVCMSEMQMIRNTLIWMKHDLYPNCYEKIFISHREKDKEQVAAFIELLYTIGIPRPTLTNNKKTIFCTSHPSAYIENGVNNLEEIRKQFQSHEHTLYILWYTDAYFESQACLNEAGAIWAMDKKYQEILSPTLKSEAIGGLLNKQPVWFRSNDKYRLNTFKDQIEVMFNLSPITMNEWEFARDKFITEIHQLYGIPHN